MEAWGKIYSQKRYWYLLDGVSSYFWKVPSPRLGRSPGQVPQAATPSSQLGHGDSPARKGLQVAGRALKCLCPCPWKKEGVISQECSQGMRRKAGVLGSRAWGSAMLDRAEEIKSSLVQRSRTLWLVSSLQGSSHQGQMCVFIYRSLPQLPLSKEKESQ